MIGIDMFLHHAAIDSKRGFDAADIAGLSRIALNDRVSSACGRCDPVHRKSTLENLDIANLQIEHLDPVAIIIQNGMDRIVVFCPGLPDVRAVFKLAAPIAPPGH